MLHQQTQNFRRLKNLFRQLRSFGLNPNDWKVERTSMNEQEVVHIFHRADRDFRFRGRLARGNQGEIYLRNLRLMSLYV